MPTCNTRQVRHSAPHTDALRARGLLLPPAFLLSHHAFGARLAAPGGAGLQA